MEIKELFQENGGVIIHVPSGATVATLIDGEFVIRDINKGGAVTRHSNVKSAIQKLVEIDRRILWRRFDGRIILDGWNDDLEVKYENGRWWPSRCGVELVTEDGNFVSYSSYIEAQVEAIAHRYGTPSGSTYSWYEQSDDDEDYEPDF